LQNGVQRFEPFLQLIVIQPLYRRAKFLFHLFDCLVSRGAGEQQRGLPVIFFAFLEYTYTGLRASEPSPYFRKNQRE